MTIENGPEHIYWAHHGTGAANGGRSQGGTEILSYEELPDGHGILKTRQARRKTEAVFEQPGINLVEFAPNFVSLFLAVPVSRTESRFFIASVNNLPKKPISFIFSLLPRWYTHLQIHDVLDGDNVFLRGVQRELPEPAEWKNKFLPLTSNCDKFIVWVREWMDKYRDDMPWGSEKHPLPDVPRSAMLERYNSHVVHCKSCMRAFKAFERGVVVAEILVNMCLVVLISCIMIAVTGNISPSQQKKFYSCMAFAVMLLATSVFLRRLFSHMKQQFILTDNARKLLLTS